MRCMEPHGVGGSVPAGTVFDRAASTYGRVGPDFFTDLGELLVNRSNVPVGSKLIDVGAGTGAVTRFAAAQVGSAGSVLAIDVAPEMLAHLRQRLEGKSPVTIATGVMDAGRLGVRSGLFDAALSGIALQSMPDPRAAVAEMCRVVRSGGTCGISICTGWWWEEDPRWQWHANLLCSLDVAIEEVPMSAGGNFLQKLLSGMPFLDVELTRDLLEFEFDSAEVFYEWCWSHGWRNVMERLTDEQLKGYRRGVFESIGDSPIAGRLVVYMATATRS
jgi:ubiquinone/menaquinone biosynthesis C-methylase UbiE